VPTNAPHPAEAHLDSPAATATTRVAVLDDHPASREGVERIIESTPDLAVVISASSGAQLLAEIARTPVDVCIVDLSLPDIDGIELIGRLRELAPDTQVLVFTMHTEEAFGVNSIRAGALGYLTKGAAPSQLRDAIRCVRRGQMSLTPALTTLLFRKDATTALPHATLSPREWAVFIRLASGERNAEISRELSLDQRTVSSYRRRVLDKLGVNTDADLARYAVTHQLLEPEGGASVETNRGGINQDVVSAWERLAEELPLAVVVTDLGGQVTHWSSHAAALYGWSREEAIGVNIMQLTVAPETTSVAADIMGQLTKGQTWEGEFRALRKGGSLIDVHVFDIPVFDEEGHLAGICGLSLDVTTQRGELQDRLTRSQELFASAQRTKESERARIAADIHDDIGQHITSLRTELLGIIEDPDITREAITDIIADALTKVDSVLTEVRRICSQLRPPTLDRLGLVDTLRTQCAEGCARAQRTCRMSLDGYGGELGADDELELFRIAQEALTNVERHAGATSVSLYLATEAEGPAGARVVLEVEDDGVGFDTQDPGARRTLGLALLAERARRLNAVLTVESSTDPQHPGGRGTLVRLEIPLAGRG